MIVKIENENISGLARSLRGRLATVYGEGEALAMTRLIFHALKGWDATALVIHGDAPVSDTLREKCEEVVGRVLAGEPIQYVLGETYFYGMNLKVAPGVLIPRPETAELVDMVVNGNKGSDLRVLDIGTGSGAIAVALSRNLRFPIVTAIDISPEAVAIARANAERLKARIDFLNVDIFTWNPPAESFDIIVSNPPYVAESEKTGMDRNVLEHEPPEALFVPDADPLIYYSRICGLGREALSRQGRIYLEINPRFAQPLAAMFEKEGYGEVSLHKDSYGRIRFLSAVNKGWT